MSCIYNEMISGAVWHICKPHEPWTMFTGLYYPTVNVTSLSSFATRVEHNSTLKKTFRMLCKQSVKSVWEYDAYVQPVCAVK